MAKVSAERTAQALARAESFFMSQLANSASGGEFLEQRGVDTETRNRYRLGYAPRDWQALVNAVGDRDAAVAAGLASSAESGHVYAKFRDRLMFPIRNSLGTLVAFGGRALANGTDPKYLNSPESALFSKRDTLYGLHEARVHSPSRLVVCEGFLDTLACSACGIPAVAAMGTALGATHVEQLFEQAPTLVLCFDGDEAGQRALDRALLLTLPYLTADRALQVALLPDGHDPDSYRRAEGSDALRAFLDTAPSVTEYLVGRHIGHPQGPHYGFDGLRPYIEAIPDAFAQSLLLERYAAEDPSMSPGQLAEASENIRYLGDPPVLSGRDSAPTGHPMSADQARTIVIRSLFSCPDVARFADIPTADQIFGDPVLRELARMGELVRQGQAVSGVALIREWQGRPETQPFVERAMNGGVLSPALARECVVAGTRILLEQTRPTVVPEQSSLGA